MKKLLYLLPLIFFSACSKKQILENQTDVPRFYFEGIIGNQEYKIEAGNNNFYMNTGYSDDGNTDLLWMYGDLNNQSSSLKIEFSGYDLITNANIIANALSSGGAYSFSLDSLTVSSVTEKFKFYSRVLGTKTWDLGDGTILIGDTVFHTYTSDGLKNVILTNVGSCSDSISNTINTTVGNNCLLSFTFQNYFNTDTFGFVANSNPNFTSYSWDFGDGNFGNGITVGHKYLDTTTTLRNVILTATSTSCGSVSFRSKLITVDNNCKMFNFMYEKLFDTSLVFAPNPNFIKTIITWQNDGKTYKSYKTFFKGVQSNKKVMDIIGIEPYSQNIAGQNTVLLKGKTDIYLYNEIDNNDSIRFQTNNYHFAIAYPNL